MSRTKGALDKRPRKNANGRGAVGVDLDEMDVQVFSEALDVIEQGLDEYLRSPETQQAYHDFLHTDGRKPLFAPRKFLDRGMAYFRNALKKRHGVSIGLLALYIFPPGQGDYKTLLRMEHRKSETTAYTNDLYRPIVEAFKTLIVAYHEMVTGRRLNPSFGIFMLKAMRGGFEEKIEIENVTPQGLDETTRLALRDKVKNFTEKQN